LLASLAQLRGWLARVLGNVVNFLAYALKNKVRPMLRYLNRLKRRMHYRGFHHNDRQLTSHISNQNIWDFKRPYCPHRPLLQDPPVMLGDEPSLPQPQ
jgi:hypothetical protein